MINAYRSQAYDAPKTFRTRAKAADKSQTVHHLPLDRGIAPGGTVESGHSHYMEETSEYSYALNTGLMREVGQRGVHSNIDAIPIRPMAADGVYAARPDRGTMYDLGVQYQPAYPIHPLSTLAYIKRPIEDHGNFDPQQRPLFIDSYQSQNQKGQDEVF